MELTGFLLAIILGVCILNMFIHIATAISTVRVLRFLTGDLEEVDEEPRPTRGERQFEAWARAHGYDPESVRVMKGMMNMEPPPNYDGMQGFPQNPPNTLKEFIESEE